MKLSAAIPAVGIALLLGSSVQAQPARTLIDDFATAQAANSQAMGPDMLGGARLLGTRSQTGSAVAVADGLFSAHFTACNGCRFDAALAWPGAKYRGFGPTDFTAGGAHDALVLAVTTQFGQAALPLQILVSSGLRNVSRANVVLAGADSGERFVKFASFEALPGLAAADLTKITALSIALVDVTTSFDLYLSRIETAAEPKDPTIDLAVYIDGVLQRFSPQQLVAEGGTATQDEAGTLRLSMPRCQLNYWMCVPGMVEPFCCPNGGSFSAVRSGALPAGTTVMVKVLGLAGFPGDGLNTDCRIDRLSAYATIAYLPIPGAGLRDHTVKLPSDEPQGLVLRCGLSYGGP
jgi:hypothetical protein